MPKLSKAAHRAEGKVVRLNLQRELPLLLFLWRWKFSTSSALAARYYPGLASHTAYNRLEALQRGGYIELKFDETGNYRVWTLTTLGFKIVKEHLPPLASDGFRSENIRHDLIVNAAHLGDWLLRAPSDITLCTEQEMRRLALEARPKWLPNPDVHRPDGYWLIKKGASATVVSLEVELSRKSKAEFDRLVAFYNDYSQIKHVLWVVPGLQSARRILTQMNLDPDTQRRHCFVITDQFMKSGWDAPIRVGSQSEIPIRNFFGNLISENPKTIHGNSAEIFPSLFLLDTRKRSFLSSTYQNLKKPEIGVTSGLADQNS